jgi:hypothetical protein
MRRLPGFVVSSLALLVLASVAGLNAPAGASTGSARSRSAGFVANAVHHDVSPPLRDIKPSTTQGKAHPALRVHSKPEARVPAKDTSGTSQRPTIPSPIANFDGISANGSAPPDTSAAAGLTQVAELVNTKFAVYNKTGGILYGPVNTNTIWSGFGGGCQTNNDGDGQVQWDPLAQRWFVDQFSVSTTPFLMCLAVSTSTDATGSYFRYSFSYTNFPDYPKIGIWPDAYYAAINMFNAAGTQALGTMVCAYDRAKMLTGAAATQQCKSPYTSGEHTLAPATVQGTTAPPAGETHYEVGLGEGANSLQYWKFHVDWVTPGNSTLTGPTVLSVTAFSKACSGGGTCIPQSGTTQKLDSLGDRVMTSMNYRNYGDHEALVVSHSITAGSSVGKRWYELRVGAGNTLSVFQQGTVAPDSAYRWMGSIGQDKSGDFALGYSVSSSSLRPGIRYTGRLPSDPLGSMPQGEATIITGAGSQTGGLSRWGDYSAITIDPADDCTFWYANEYIPANGSFNWRTRLASFKFTQCGGTVTNDFSISANPSSLTVTQGNSANSTISTVITSGVSQSVSLSASGLPSGASASFNPNPINSGSSSTATISTAPSTPTGTYTVTVTGTGTSATHSTTISLTVNAPAANDFSISANPSSLTVIQGNSANSTISTVITSGVSQSVSLSASGLPSGATASFSPNPINSGSSSTATLSTAASTPTGTYTITVTGTGTSATHSTTISLTVNAAGSGNLLLNPGFENGSLPPWVATAGVLNNSSAEPPHSGLWDAWLDGYGTSHTDSLYQQVAIPSSVTSASLSLWLHIDTAETTTTIAYDTLKVQIRNTSNQVLATLATYSNLNKAAGYSLKSFDVSAFKGQTIRVYLLGVEDVSLQTSFVADDFTLSTA